MDSGQLLTSAHNACRSDWYSQFSEIGIRGLKDKCFLSVSLIQKVILVRGISSGTSLIQPNPTLRYHPQRLSWGGQSSRNPQNNKFIIYPNTGTSLLFVRGDEWGGLNTLSKSFLPCWWPQQPTWSKSPAHPLRLHMEPFHMKLTVSCKDPVCTWTKHMLPC